VSEARPSCPPDLTLEEHLAGDLSPDSRYASHVQTCAQCADRLAAMRSTGAAYVSSDAAEKLRRRLGELDRDRSRRRRSVWLWGAAAPVAAAAAWVALHRTPAPNDLTAKGSATVQLLVGHDGHVAPWTGRALAKGDALQLSWTSAKAGYVAVIGREDTGATERWFPEGDGAARLEPGTRTFGDSLRFDPPFSGTVFVLVSDSPFGTSALSAAIREQREPAFNGEKLELRVPRTP
jgi:hypothetical protein